MDTFRIQNLKFEKADSVLKYRRLQKITSAFRFMEICVFLIVISGLSSQLAVALQVSGEFLRCLSANLVSPGFVFVIGNAIIVVIFLKSEGFSSQDSSTPCYSGVDFPGEYVEIVEKNREINAAEAEIEPKLCEIKGDSDIPKQRRRIHRSKSENLKPEICEEQLELHRELRRSATETSRRSKPAASLYPEDELSSEEFRRTVEAFIARQQKFLREEESSAIVAAS